MPRSPLVLRLPKDGASSALKQHACNGWKKILRQAAREYVTKNKDGDQSCAFLPRCERRHVALQSRATVGMARFLSTARGLGEAGWGGVGGAAPDGSGKALTGHIWTDSKGQSVDEISASVRCASELIVGEENMMMMMMIGQCESNE
jgi:hypothetical protein